MPASSPATGAFLIFALLLHACSTSPERRAAQYTSKGKELLLSHDYARATLQFRNAIAATPKNAELHFLLGEAYLGEKSLAAAFREYRRAKEIDPNHTQSGLRLAQLMATSGNAKILGDALVDAQAAVAANPQSIAAIDTLALLEMRLGKLDDAIQHLEQSRAQMPANLQSAIALSGLKFGQGDRAGAEKVLQDAIQADPKSPAGYVELGTLLERVGRRDEARKHYDRALSLDPNNGPALLGIVRQQVRERRPEEAEQTYKRLSALPDKRYKMLHALFLMESGRQNEALQELARLHKDNPEDRTFRGYLLAAYARMKRWDEATKLVESGLAANPKDIDLLLSVSKLYQLRGDYAAAEKRLNSVLHSDPNLAGAHYLLSKVHEANGKPALQQHSLEEVLRCNRALLSARTELAILLSANRGGNAALQVMDEAPKSQQETVPFLVGRNWVLMALQDWDGLKAGIKKGLAVREAPDLMLQDGLLKLQLGDYRGARAPLQRVLAADPGNIPAVKGLARSYLAEGLAPTALAQVRDFAVSRPKSPTAQHVLGTVYLAAGRIPEARAAFEATKKLDPNFVEADLSLAQMDIWVEALPQARATLNGVLATHPKIAAARLLLGSVEERSGNIPSAVEQYQKAVELAPNNGVALNNIAYLLSTVPDRYDEAFEYADRAIKTDPGNMAFQDTYGWLLYRKGRYAEAVKYLEKSAPQTKIAAVHYHLAMAYIRAGNQRRGMETMQKAVGLDPHAPEAREVYEVLAKVNAEAARR